MCMCISQICPSKNNNKSTSSFPPKKTNCQQNRNKKNPNVLRMATATVLPEFCESLISCTKGSKSWASRRRCPCKRSSALAKSETWDFKDCSSACHRNQRTAWDRKETYDVLVTLWDDFLMIFTCWGLRTLIFQFFSGFQSKSFKSTSPVCPVFILQF